MNTQTYLNCTEEKIQDKSFHTQHQSVEIQSYNKHYKAEICPDITQLQKLSELKDACFVIDRNVYSLYREQLFWEIPESRLFVLDATEENKTAATALSICEWMSGLPARRNAWLVSFGGGITQDVTGFAANILYRGVHWIFLPTTLLAACDSCIGGKTSLNYGPYKNLLGTFYAPDSIYICPQFFHTLSDRDFYSGLGEVVKFSLMTGETGIRLLEQNIDRLLARKESAVWEFLLRSLNFKKPFIEADEFDRGVRIQLNFAHTFGHALETASRYAVAHGTAVAMGMIAANRISVQRGYLSAALARRMEALLLRIIPKEAVTALNQSGNSMQDAEHAESTGCRIRMEQITDAMKKDKKQTGTAITTVLLKESPAGKLSLQITPDTEEREAAQAAEYLYQVLNSKLLS